MKQYHSIPIYLFNKTCAIHFEMKHVWLIQYFVVDLTYVSEKTSILCPTELKFSPIFVWYQLQFQWFSLYPLHNGSVYDAWPLQVRISLISLLDIDTKLWKTLLNNMGRFWNMFGMILRKIL